MSNSPVTFRSPGQSCGNADSDTGGPGCSLRSCISSKPLGASKAAGPGTTLSGRSLSYPICKLSTLSNEEIAGAVVPKAWSRDQQHGRCYLVGDANSCAPSLRFLTWTPGMGVEGSNLCLDKPSMSF